MQDDASAGIQSLQTSIEIKLCQNPVDRLYTESLQNASELSLAEVLEHFENFSLTQREKFKKNPGHHTSLSDNMWISFQ